MAPNDTARPNAGHDGFSTSRWRRNRSSANLLDQTVPPTPTPAVTNNLNPTPKPERAQSRMSLFNLFSKPKVEKARGHTEIGLAIPMQSQEPPKSVLSSPPKSALRPNPPPQAQQVQRMRSSQLLRPMSMRPSSIKRPPKHDDWDPPPLFQAYPQAIKYATVRACVFSPDALMRTQSQRRQAEIIRERMDSHRDLTAIQENAAEPNKLEKTHKRLDSILNSTPQLTHKIYILVTAGYVLQYSDDGPFDRPPERVLKLGKDSAAFASDLIPGKHWVLQILQSANEDGTTSAAPRHSLLSRLRLSGNVRKPSASFLLVMESAGEMESWMTAVRKEIENLGGMKASSESSRGSSSIDESQGKPSTESSYQRQPVKRNSSRLSMLTPIDSPLQSQYVDSPKIVASEWEGDRHSTRSNNPDSTSVRPGVHRQSIEAPSIATTIVSHDQLQLDQLRERSRHSYMSTATSVSGAGTRSTSRTSSPAPTSPLKDVFSPADAEPRRSATSLKSFHMSTTVRRRSMQPLPITNEDSSLPAGVPPTPERHSIYGPTSPTSRDSRKLDIDASTSTAAGTKPVAPALTPASAPTPAPLPTSTPAPTAAAPTNYSRHSTVLQSHSLYPRYNTRSSSAPPSRNKVLSPPPREPAPNPPTERPQSTIGSLPASTATESTTPSNFPSRRISTTPKPFLRPFPVRPQTQAANGSYILPRRSSLAPGTGPAPIPLGIVVNRSVTAPARPPSTVPNPTPQTWSGKTMQAGSGSQSLRRPTSVQIRSDPAPFLSSSRPSRTVSSTPSFMPGKRASPSTSSTLHNPAIPVLKGYGEQLATPKGLAPQRSMPAIALPPPAPPPDMPLPPPPPVGPPRAVAV